MDSPIYFLEYLSELYKPEQDWLFEKLLWKLQSGRNLALIADQGWGIQEYVNELRFQLNHKNPDIQTCLVDVRPAHTSSNFLDLLASSLLNRFPEQASSLEMEKGCIRILLMPGLLAQKLKTKIVVFIANAHLVQRFPDCQFFLRSMKSKFRNQRNCVFCLYGSSIPFFRDLFESTGPLSGWGQVFQLTHNPFKHRSASVRKLFHDHNKRIGHSTSIKISCLVDNHPFYLKLLAWHALILTRNTCSLAIVERALENLILHFDQRFYLIIESLTEKQLSFLKALMQGNQKLHAEEIRKRYNLGATGNVTRIKSSLEGRQIIQSSRLGIEFTDPIFREWLERRYFNRYQ